MHSKVKGQMKDSGTSIGMGLFIVMKEKFVEELAVLLVEAVARICFVA